MVTVRGALCSILLPMLEARRRAVHLLTVTYPDDQGAGV